MTLLFLDADACPVTDDVYRVATRHKLGVFVVSTNRVRTPQDLRIMPVVVEGGASAADKWIADRVKGADVVITADIPLAERVVKKGARAVHPAGRVVQADKAPVAPSFVHAL